MSSIENILESLGALSAQDLRRVRGAIDILITVAGDQHGDGDSIAETLWGEIVSVAKERGIEVDSFPAVRKRRDFPSFRRHAEESNSFIMSATEPKTKTEEVQALRLVARAFVRRLEKLRDALDAPITTARLMSHSANIVAYVQQEWPGGPDELRMVLRR